MPGLLQFLSDFDGPEGNNLFRRFQDNEAAVYEEYGITAEDVDSVRKLTPNARTLLPAPVAALIAGVLDRPGEELKWPGPKLRVAEVKPKSIPRGEQELTIVITVLEFPTNAPHKHDGKPYEVRIVFTHTDGTTVKGTPISPLELEPGDISRVSLVCTATFVKRGRYGGLIKVIGKPEGEAQYEEEAWFTSAYLTVT